MAEVENILSELFAKGVISKESVWIADQSTALNSNLLSSDLLTTAPPQEPTKDTTEQFVPEQLLGFLSKGVHEFCSKGTFYPAALPALFAASLLKLRVGKLTAETNHEHPRSLLWIGKESFPTPFFLRSCGLSLSNCFFINAPNEKLHWWAVEAALRSPAQIQIVAACPRFSVAISRRLSFLARTNQATLFLLRRHFRLPLAVSFSNSRWSIEPRSSLETGHGNHPAEAIVWKLQLLQGKGFFGCNSYEIHYREDKGWAVHEIAKPSVSLHLPSTMVG